MMIRPSKTLHPGDNLTSTEFIFESHCCILIFKMGVDSGTVVAECKVTVELYKLFPEDAVHLPAVYF